MHPCDSTTEYAEYVTVTGKSQKQPCGAYGHAGNSNAEQQVGGSKFYKLCVGKRTRGDIIIY